MTIISIITGKNPLDSKEIQPVHSKGDQSWDFFGRNDSKAETPVFCPPHVKSWLIGKYFDVGRDWGQEEKGTTENEMAGWYHRLNGRESEWTLGVGDGQGGLVCCDSWGCKESDTTERLNWTELNWKLQMLCEYYSFKSWQLFNFAITCSWLLSNVNCLCFLWFFFLTRAYMVSCFSHVQLCVILWTVACQAPLSMGFTRQLHWSGLPFPSPGDLPNPGLEPWSPAL